MASQQVYDPEIEKDASLSDTKEEVKHVERVPPHGHELHVKNARFANAKLHTTLLTPIPGVQSGGRNTHYPLCAPDIPSRGIRP